MGGEVDAQGPGQRHPPASRTALGLHGPRLGVPASLDADEPSLEVDVRPAQGGQLPAAQAGVEGGGPHRPVGHGGGLEEGARLRWARHPISATPDRREGEALGRIQVDLRARDGAAVDGPQRQDGVSDR